MEIVHDFLMTNPLYRWPDKVTRNPEEQIRCRRCCFKAPSIHPDKPATHVQQTASAERKLPLQQQTGLKSARGDKMPTDCGVGDALSPLAQLSSHRTPPSTFFLFLSRHCSRSRSTLGATPGTQIPPRRPTSVDPYCCAHSGASGRPTGGHSHVRSRWRRRSGSSQSVYAVRLCRMTWLCRSWMSPAHEQQA